MQKTMLVLMVAAVLALTSCKKEGGSAETNKEAAPSGMLGTAAGKASANAAQAALPQPDQGKALSTYPELDSGEQLMFHYVAASALPPDIEKLAQSYSSEYRQTTDTFRKRDLLQALQPQIEQKIQQAKAEPYAWMDIETPELGAYDFQRKGFPIGEFEGKRSRYFNDAYQYKLTWANRDQVKFAPVVDEAAARELESMRSDWNNKPRLKIYFLGQSADLNEQTLNALVTRVQVVSKSGKVLAEYSPDGSVPAKAADEAGGGANSAAEAADAVFGG